MPLVEFRNVGREKMTWQASLASTASEHLEHELKRKGALMTVNMGMSVDFSDDPGVNGGRILVGGIRAVGEWRVIEEQ